jgi:hypothetical protein
VLFTGGYVPSRVCRPLHETPHDGCNAFGHRGMSAMATLPLTLSGIIWIGKHFRSSRHS